MYNDLNNSANKEVDACQQVLSPSPVQPPSHRHPNPVHSCSPHATMECERWLHARLDDLRMKTVLDQKTDAHLPLKLEKNYVEFYCNERNIRGETLIISVIRYEPDKANQIRYINMLARSGCDLSLPDSRQLRTPLMVACLMRNDAIAHHLITHNANLTAADKMGNTALMYAAMYSQSSLVSYLAEELGKRWALEAFRAKNRMGYTAESLARKHERYMFSMLLKKQRLKIVKRLREFVASNLKYSPEFVSWKRFICIYKAKRKFLSFVQQKWTTSTRAVEAITSTFTGNDLLHSKSSLPHLENIQAHSSMAVIEGNGLQKSRSVSEFDLRSTNLPKLPNKIGMTRRLTKRNITSKIAHGLSSVCPHISISSC
ncbi:hypothetical protein Tcan_15887 [Toxocara canis]|uniref:Uncharacterized protein n=2 Tax=Toxocara canis TaxID=6265 RepID=A0A0B2V9H5_TOXCA|nr:hypothetical protein Tcan_15887 [Toxocara canis]VDM46449.1 unnamed protein product [Toxocara canis]